jgi:hypothetical protein
MEHFGTNKRGEWNAFLSADNIVYFMVGRSQACSMAFTSREEALTQIERYRTTGWVN